MAETGEVHHDPQEVRTRTGQSSITEAARKVPLRCRAKGKLYDHRVYPCNQGRARCTCLSQKGGTHYGSARVSSDDHNPPLYLSALPKAGCTTIGTEAGLAGTTVQRPPLSPSLKTLRAGNTRMLSTCDP